MRFGVKKPTFSTVLFENNGPIDNHTAHLFSDFKMGYEINEVVTKENLDTISTLASEYYVVAIAKAQNMQLKEFTSIQTLSCIMNLCNKYPFIDSMDFSCKWIEKYALKFDLNLAFHPKTLANCGRSTVHSELDISFTNPNVMCIFALINR